MVSDKARAARKHPRPAPDPLPPRRLTSPRPQAPVYVDSNIFADWYIVKSLISAASESLYNVLRIATAHTCRVTSWYSACCARAQLRWHRV